MKIYALNSSPRKNWNTHRMLEAFLEGARSAGEDVETELVHLFDLTYQGCHSCFACKVKNGKSYSVCAWNDDIRGLLAQVSQGDGLVCGCPIYFHDVPAQLRAFLERLFFQYHSFKAGERTLAPKMLHSAMIYTMNVTEEEMKANGYLENLATLEHYFPYTFGYEPQLVYAYNTYEFTDYSHYEASYFDETDKRAWRENQFPQDLKNAYEAGCRMVEEIRKSEL